MLAIASWTDWPDSGLLCPRLELRPAGLGRHPEDVLGAGTRPGLPGVGALCPLPFEANVLLESISTAKPELKKTESFKRLAR